MCEAPCAGTWWPDADGDGGGDPLMPVISCVQPPGYGVDPRDLDDTDPTIRSGSCTTEVFGSSVYRFCTDTVDWSAAQADCAGMGGHLVTLGDSVENTWVGQVMDDVSPGVAWWTGYNDAGTEGAYVWEDGTPSGFENWAGTEPSAATATEDCVTTVGLFYEWDVRECANVYGYICEID